MPPLFVISDVFQPIDSAPPWLRAIASALPLCPFADDLESAFNPILGTRAIHPGHLELMGFVGRGRGGVRAAGLQLGSPADVSATVGEGEH
ncbi:MAG: hypothetical protein ACXVVQ_19085 [Solirubrobacteraceae bacterium]